MKRGKLFIKYKIEGANCFYLIDRLHKQKVPVYNCKEEKNCLIISIDRCDCKKLFAISRNMCYNISIISYYGRLSPLITILHKLGLAVCFALFFLTLTLFDGWVSKIVYKGDGQSLSTYIEQVLLEEGIKENCFFRANSKDLSQKILKSSDKFSFVSVEKKGRLLIIEAYGVTQPPEPLDFKKEKIVSPVKGEVISINLMGGTATVSVGDKVKTGQTLIGGYKVDGETEVKTYALGEVEIKAEFVYEYKSFAKGEKYKNRAITVAKEMLGEESVIEILVEEKENNQQIIYKITLFYTVIAS